MSDLEELERERGNSEFVETMGSLGGVQNFRSRTASNEMCTFLVMNISSLQLIPVNIIAYRSQYGSSHRTRDSSDVFQYGSGGGLL